MRAGSYPGNETVHLLLPEGCRMISGAEWLTSDSTGTERHDP